MKVKRLSVSCCGMEVGETYDAEWEYQDMYIVVHLPNGTKTSAHYFPGFFEIQPTPAKDGE